jgi:hypothetical protein
MMLSCCCSAAWLIRRVTAHAATTIHAVNFDFLRLAQNTTITTLNLSDALASLGDGAIVQLSAALGAHPTLQLLSLDSNQFRDREQCTRA